MSGKRLSNKQRKKQARKKARANTVLKQMSITPVKDSVTRTVRMDPLAISKITRLVDGNRKLECGAFLIGNICTDQKTGMTIAFINDICTDWKYGTASEYSFSNELQVQTICHIRKKFGHSAHVIGTVHSHGTFPAFFSSVDDVMMNDMGPQMIQMVISPSRFHYVLTMMDKNMVRDDGIELDTTGAGRIFTYTRRKDNVH